MIMSEQTILLSVVGMLGLFATLTVLIRSRIAAGN